MSTTPTGGDPGGPAWMAGTRAGHAHPRNVLVHPRFGTPSAATHVQMALAIAYAFRPVHLRAAGRARGELRRAGHPPARVAGQRRAVRDLRLPGGRGQPNMHANRG